MNSTIMTPAEFVVKTPATPTVEFVVQADADYATGKRLYWQGAADSRCANNDQVRGWYAACEEDDRGRAAYYRAMQLAEADGEHVNWRNVHDICDIQYNAYGDVVRSA